MYDPNDSWVMQEYAKAQGVLGATVRAGFLNVKQGAIRAVLIGGYAALVMGTLILGYLAAGAPTDSFRQAMLVEITAGAGFFVMAPLVFAAGKKWPILVVVEGGLIALALSIGASMQDGVWQSFLIECATGIIILIALEQIVQRWFTRLEEARASSIKAMHDAQDQADELEQSLGPNIIGHGFPDSFGERPPSERAPTGQDGWSEDGE